VKRLSLYIAAAALGIGMMQSSHNFAAAQSVPQATPTPVMPAPVATGQPGSATITLPVKASATATPAPPTDEDAKRVGISGVWEVQIQQPSTTIYTHMKLAQTGTALTGQYLDTNGKKYPITGSVDGKDIHVVVTMPNGTALVFSGSVEGGTDIAGTLDSAKDTVGFTAEYRPKYKWIDNLSPNPGIPGQTGIP
jgi:hypothetical protein